MKQRIVNVMSLFNFLKYALSNKNYN
ncbi:hypothetical protein IMPERIA75_180017 [Imperialibacter sp. 75]|nr:hypothetical protein IMPERIA75_180017 [Imperialibacter sp. 75]